MSKMHLSMFQNADSKENIFPQWYELIPSALKLWTSGKHDRLHLCYFWYEKSIGAIDLSYDPLSFFSPDAKIDVTLWPYD